MASKIRFNGKSDRTKFFKESKEEAVELRCLYANTLEHLYALDGMNIDFVIDEQEKIKFRQDLLIERYHKLARALQSLGCLIPDYQGSRDGISKKRPLKEYGFVDSDSEIISVC